jgi:hypothetical protein
MTVVEARREAVMTVVEARREAVMTVVEAHREAGMTVVALAHRTPVAGVDQESRIIFLGWTLICRSHPTGGWVEERPFLRVVENHCWCGVESQVKRESSRCFVMGKTKIEHDGCQPKSRMKHEGNHRVTSTTVVVVAR